MKGRMFLMVFVFLHFCYLLSQGQAIIKMDGKYFVEGVEYQHVNLPEVLISKPESYNLFMKGRRSKDVAYWLFIGGTAFTGAAVYYNFNLSSEPGPELGKMFLSASLAVLFDLTALMFAMSGKSSQNKAIREYNEEYPISILEERSQEYITFSVKASSVSISMHF